MKYFELLRVREWVKNLFLYLPFFFSGELFDQAKLTRLTMGCLLFSLAASCIYIVNDYRDRERDTLHPKKRYRPLATGSIQPGFALTLSAVMGIGVMGASYILNREFFFILLTYLTLNLCYSYGLKNLPIIDISIIAIGFVLRVEAGTAITNVFLSMWMVLLVFLLALLLALGKRRDDVILKNETSISLRKSIDGYNLEFLNVSIALICAVTFVSYIMYTVSPEIMQRMGSNRLYYTCLFVFIGIMRYLQLVFVKNESGSPTKILLMDRLIQAMLLLWLVSFFLLIYVKGQ